MNWTFSMVGGKYTELTDEFSSGVAYWLPPSGGGGWRQPNHRIIK